MFAERTWACTRLSSHEFFLFMQAALSIIDEKKCDIDSISNEMKIYLSDNQGLRRRETYFHIKSICALGLLNIDEKTENIFLTSIGVEEFSEINKNYGIIEKFSKPNRKYKKEVLKILLPEVDFDTIISLMDNISSSFKEHSHCKNNDLHYRCLSRAFFDARYIVRNEEFNEAILKRTIIPQIAYLMERFRVNPIYSNCCELLSIVRKFNTLKIDNDELENVLREIKEDEIDFEKMDKIICIGKMCADFFTRRKYF